MSVKISPREEQIPTEFNYKSHFIKINGNDLHYIDEGKGDPILFLHGIPASSYVWRNIIPVLAKKARCIAPDLIGMGKSAKPDIAYRVFDHIDYIEKFIAALGLKNITLVLHGWGSVIGFDYAMRHSENIKALAFYEAHVIPVGKWEELSLPIQQLSTLLKNPSISYKAIVENDYFIDKLLPSASLRKLSKEELEYYRAPFTTPASRKPLWQYIQDVPLGNGPKDVEALMQNYAERLKKSKMPKLLLYAIPGFMTTMASVQWCKQNLSNLSLVDLGMALHFAQEYQPRRFSEALLKWYEGI